MNVGTKGHIDHGCDLCGCKGIHACTGKPMAPWTLEEKNKLNDALCSIANTAHIDQYQRLVDVEGGRVFFKLEMRQKMWSLVKSVKVDNGDIRAENWPQWHCMISASDRNMTWFIEYIHSYSMQDCQSFFDKFKEFAK